MPGHSYNAGVTATKEKFTGKERDADTGFDYFGARYYASGIGRWLSVDPLAENYPSWSPYNYVLNNPVGMVDSTGMCPDNEPNCTEVVIEAKANVLGKINAFLNRIGDKVQTGLDVVGMVPIVGDVADVVNVGISLGRAGLQVAAGNSAGAREHLKNAAVSAVASLAVVGTAVGLAKIVTKNGDEAVEAFVRLRHYTNKKGIDGIEESGEIIAKDQNKVFFESANKKPLNSVRAEDKYQIKDGHGRNYVETDVPESRVTTVHNSRTGSTEKVVEGNVQLRNPTFVRRKQ